MTQTWNPSVNMTTTNTLSVAIAPSKTVLTITADGKKMRGDRELKDLSADELLVVIDDLIDLIRRH